MVSWENYLLALLNFEVLGFSAYVLLLLCALFLQATVSFAICCYNSSCPIIDCRI